MKLIYLAAAIVCGVIAMLAVRHFAKRNVSQSTIKAVEADHSSGDTEKSATIRSMSDLQSLVDSLMAENQQLRESVENKSGITQNDSAMRIADLREVITRMPEQAIPELQLATEADWHAAADGPLETADDFRRALAALRTSAERRFADLAHVALESYLSANADVFPSDVTQLAPYFAGSIDPRILARYEIVPSSRVNNIRVGGDWAITQRSLIDEVYDLRCAIGIDGYGATSEPEGP